MNTRIAKIMVLSVSAFVLLRAQVSPRYNGEPPPHASPENIYRKAAGRYWNLAPLYLRNGTSIPGWQNIAGHVTQNSGGGIFIRTYASGQVFVRRYPYLVSDGAFISLFAYADGVKQFETVQHSTATVPQYDYGEPYDPFLLPPKTNLEVKSTASNSLGTNAAASATNKPFKMRTIYK